ILEFRRLGERAPEVVLDYQEFRFGMREQLQLLSSAEFVVERNQDSTAVKDRVSGDQPLGLVGHDDGGAITGREVLILKSARERHGQFLEVRVSQASALALAVGFNQASLVGEAVDGVAQCCAERAVLIEVEH